MPELYSWVFLVPLFLAMISTALGRPRLFRVTPKTSPATSRLLPSGCC